MFFRALARVSEKLDDIVDNHEVGSIPHMVAWPLSIRIGNILYFAPMDNRHALPYISNLLCRMGRHDYEFDGVDDKGYGRLECFKCGALKRSYPISRGTE